MAVALLTVLGYSDLAHRDGRDLRRQFREETRRLLEEVDTDSEVAFQVQLPILGPMIRLVATRFGQVHYLFVLGTDQNPPNSGDTLFAAQILERLHQLGHPDLQRVRQVAWATLKGNPADYDQMFAGVPKALEDAAGSLRDGPPGDIREVYVNASSGTPACTAALLFQAAARTRFLHQARVRFLYVPRGTQEVRPLGVGWLVQRDRIVDLARNMMTQCRYGALAGVLESLAQVHPVTAVLQAMEARMAWQFDRALDLLNGVPGARDLVAGVGESLEAAQRGDQLRQKGANGLLDHPDVRALIREVAMSLRARWVMRDAPGYLATLATLVEQVLRLSVQHMANPQRWPSGRLTDQVFDQVWGSLPDSLRSRVSEQVVNRRKLDRRFWSEVIAAGYAVYRDVRFDRILRWSKALERVVNLRNSLIHDLKGAGFQEIETAFSRVQPRYGRSTVEEWNEQFLKDVFEISFSAEAGHPYAAEHKAILAAIEEMAAP